MQAIGDACAVSPATVMKALRDLETDGVVRMLENGQRAVSGFRRAPGTSLLARTVVLLSDNNPAHAQADFHPEAEGWVKAVDIGVMEALHRTPMHLLAMRPSAISAAQLQQIADDPPCGLLVTPTVANHPVTGAVVAHCRKAGVPTVFQAVAPDAPAEVDCVESDHEAGAHDLTQWLIARGCHRILRVWARWTGNPAPRGWLARRDAGYERACRGAGIETMPAIVIENEHNNIPSQQEFDRDSHALAGRLWQHLHGPNPVDALMTISDGLALNATAACRILNREPNRDVMVVGYDNYWVEHPWRGNSPPPAATVDKGNLRLGQEMVALLEARLAGQLPPEPQVRLIPATFVATTPHPPAIAGEKGSAIAAETGRRTTS